MARQPDIQYIQVYNYGSTAQKLAPRPRYRKDQYQLPTQQPHRQQVSRVKLEPLPVCAIAVTFVLLISMLLGMVRVGELSNANQQLQEHLDVLQEQRAGLQKDYENAYDLAQVEQRARQMGLVYANEVFHVQMGSVEPVIEQTPGIWQRLTALFDELFAKAPK